jgi:hypothetical protein
MGYAGITMKLSFNSRKILKANTGISVCVLISTLALMGCGTDPATSPTTSPTSSETAIPSASTTPDVIQDYAFYFVAETSQGFRLVPEVQQVSKIENDLGEDKGLNSLRMLVDGQLPPYDGDHRTLWNNGTKVNSVTTVDGVATVDLTLGRISLGAESEQRAIDQMVWTLTENNSAITSVKFTVDGKVSDSLAGHVDITKAFIRAQSYEVLASVWIDLLDRSDVTNPVTISGSACTFEANVSWELTQSGDVVSSGATTAKTACPDRSDWSVDLGELAAGNYLLKVSDLSAQDGSVIFEDTKAFTVID